ncbi:MAG: tetratricopeptide repeat protein [Anaerolineae bacterium]|nr:tetratricopeptide repeat protein [Anaerolineae bacterium]
MGDTNKIDLGRGASAKQVVAGRDNTVTLIEQQIIQFGARQILDARFSLPAKPEPFEGREDEVREVVRRLREGRGSLVSGLAGLGGVGKTAVAIVAAHTVAEKFPDGQIWVELRGTSDAPMPVSEVMATVIRALEPNPDLRNPSEAELAGMYRTALHGKRVLLGLDNARDAGQVQPLLVAPPAAVLVTARTGFTLAGLVPLRLDTLKKEDAEKLLVELCPRSGGNAGELAELCGCLPLALRIAGRYLAEHEAVVVARYVGQVRERRLHSLKAEGERDLEAVFAETYDYLSDDMQTRWRALGVFVASFTASAAGYVWGLDEPDGAQEILSELARLSIVEYDAESERFDLHDLLREFAGGRLPGGERRTAEKRYAVFFKNVSSAANDLYLEGGENVVAGLKLFEQELTHIRAGQKWAAENWETNEEVARLCIEYPLDAAHTVNLRLSAREQIRWLEEAVKAARKLGDKRLEGTALGNLGSAYADLGEVRQAIGYYEQALVIAREIGDRRGEGNALGNLGLAYAALGEVRRAIEFYEQQLAIVREIGDRRGEGNALGNLGLAYYSLGEVRQAIGYYEQR